MNQSHAQLIPPATYDAFLFAQVCDDANGMHLSVLSALARMNVDPWEEATRLAAMPKAVAEKTLVSILDVVAGKIWNTSETTETAARLVRLLQQPEDTFPLARANATKAPAQSSNYWWVWVLFALSMSFLTPHHHAATTNTEVAISAGATAPSKSGTAAPNPISLSR